MKIAKYDDSLPVTIVKEGRKFGYQLIVSTQDVDDISKKIISNAGTRIFHQLDLPEYVRYVKDAVSLNEVEISKLRNLGVGEALIKLGNDPRGFFAKIDMEKVEDELEENRRCETEKEHELLSEASVNPLEKLNLDANAKLLLEDIIKNELDSVTTRYVRLGLSNEAGNEAKSKLVEQELVKEVSTPKIGGRYRGKLLTLSEEGRQLLGVYSSKREGDVLHKFVVRSVTELLDSIEIKYEKEKDNVDISIDKKLAIEIETGASDYISNIEKCVKLRYETILVIAVNKQVKHKILANIPVRSDVIVIHAAELDDSIVRRLLS